MMLPTTRSWKTGGSFARSKTNIFLARKEQERENTKSLSQSPQGVLFHEKTNASFDSLNLSHISMILQYVLTWTILTLSFFFFASYLATMMRSV